MEASNPFELFDKSVWEGKNLRSRDDTIMWRAAYELFGAPWYSTTKKRQATNDTDPGTPIGNRAMIDGQQTIDMTQQMLEFQAGDEDSAGGRQKQRGEQRGGASQQTATDSSASASQAAAQEQTAELMKKVAQQLEKQILDGSIEMESLGQQITISADDGDTVYQILDIVQG